jgi:predicted nucleotidyltransferase/DNA-binding XRE family transcriptional regulator
MESAAEVLRTAREQARLSQAELAARAGTTQSVISVYEAGRRQPSLTMLAKLVAATGYRIDVQLRRSESGSLTGPLGGKVRRRRAAIKGILAGYGVRLLGVFGSVARGEEGPDSDLDLLVEMPSSMSLMTLGRLTEELQSLLGVRVELVPASDLKPGVRPQVLAELVRL